MEAVAAVIIAFFLFIVYAIVYGVLTLTAICVFVGFLGFGFDLLSKNWRNKKYPIVETRYYGEQGQEFCYHLVQNEQGKISWHMFEVMDAEYDLQPGDYLTMTEVDFLAGYDTCEG